MPDQNYTYRVDGRGFIVTVTATEDVPVGTIVQAIMDATLGLGDQIVITRTANP